MVPDTNLFELEKHWPILCFIFSAIYGVATTPNDFATYLLAILIVNGILYLAFYVIMKVLLSLLVFPSNNNNSRESSLRAAVDCFNFPSYCSCCLLLVVET